MHLRDWIHQKQNSCTMTCKMIGVAVGYTPVTIRNIKNRRQKPSLRLAKIISEYTNGEVTVEELMNAKYRKKGKNDTPEV